MPRAGIIALLVIGTATVAATAAGRDAASPNATRCGGTLWRLKTLSDTERRSVRLVPETTRIAEIGKRPFPRPIPRRRRTPFQRQTWQVVAQITSYRLERAGVRLVLYDAYSYMNAVIPVPACLSARTRARDDITTAWKEFSAICAPRPTSGWQSLGPIAYVSGIGFWGQKGLRGSARNGAELHPVTSIRIVAGC
jgi:hypothetical protein